MKVLLVSANKLHAPYPVYPLGLELVAGAIAPRHEVHLLDLCGGDNGAAAEAVRRLRPDAVGLSLRNIDNADAGEPTGFVDDYRDLAARVRGAGEATLVLGGAAFTLFAGPLMRTLGADWGVVGEGERMLPLLDALEAGQDPSGLPGVIGGEGHKVPLSAPYQGEVRRHPAALEAMVPRYLEQGAMLNLQTKRGCPHRCAYCTYPHIEGHALRASDPEAVAAEALALERAGARYLFITDSTFNADPQHNLAVARAFREVGLGVPWGAFFAPMAVPSGYFEELHAAGLTHVEFGTEALSGPVLRAFRKPFSVEQVQKTHQQAVDAGLAVAHFLMLGGPGETRATLERTLERAAALPEAVVFFFTGVRIYPYTELRRIAVAEGQIAERDDLLSPVFYRSAALEGLDLDEFVSARAVEHPSWVVGSGGETTVRLLTRMYKKGYTGPLWEKLIR